MLTIRKPPTDKRRQAVLRAWLAYHNVSNRELAKAMHVSTSMVSRILSGDRAPRERIEQLAELGIPRRLLPQENTRRPGRPRSG